RRAERQIAQIDQIGFGAADRLRSEDFARLRKRVFIELGSDRQERLLSVHGKCGRTGDCGKQHQRCDRRHREQRHGRRDSPAAYATLRHYWTISSSEGDRNPILGAAVCSTTISSSLAARSFSGSRLFKSETSTSAFSRSIFSRIAAASFGSPASTAPTKMVR